MAKTPTLGAWELDLLRTIENVVRLGHIKHVTRREIVLDDGVGSTGAGLARGALRRLRTAVPTAGSRLGAGQDPAPDDPGRLPVLLRRSGRLRGGDPRRRPRAQPVVSAQHPPRHARPTGRGCRFVEPLAARTYGAEPDIAAWANGCALNPARIEPSQRDDACGAGRGRTSGSTSPRAGSLGWPNSHTSRCRASTEGHGERRIVECEPSPPVATYREGGGLEASDPTVLTMTRSLSRSRPELLSEELWMRVLLAADGSTSAAFAGERR